MPRGAASGGAREAARLRLGARAHFADPGYYDKAYGARREDVAYYAALARPGLRVLELGAGNGRVTLALARRGARVTAVDLSPPMLADLRRKLRGEPADVRARVQVKRGDMRRVRLGARFDLVICPFNTALHLYTREDVEAFFATVRAHLAPRGELVVDLSVPVPEDLARDPDRAYVTPRLKHPTRGVCRYAERFEYAIVPQVLFVDLTFDPLDGSPPFATPLAHRQFGPAEWEALAHYNGFRPRRVLGDWEGGPLDESSDVMIWHLVKRAPARRRSAR